MPSWRNILGISAFYHDAAAALVCEEMMLRLARPARDLTGCNQLCPAGGVALNVDRMF